MPGENGLIYRFRAIHCPLKPAARLDIHLYGVSRPVTPQPHCQVFLVDQPSSSGSEPELEFDAHICIPQLEQPGCLVQHGGSQVCPMCSDARQEGLFEPQVDLGEPSRCPRRSRMSLTYADKVQCRETVELFKPIILKISVDAQIAPHAFIVPARLAHRSLHCVNTTIRAPDGMVDGAQCASARLSPAILSQCVHCHFTSRPLYHSCVIPLTIAQTSMMTRILVPGALPSKDGCAPDQSPVSWSQVGGGGCALMHTYLCSCPVLGMARHTYQDPGARTQKLGCSG